jgi:DNA-binding IclR family transcriptional regulator
MRSIRAQPSASLNPAAADCVSDLRHSIAVPNAPAAAQALGVLKLLARHAAPMPAAAIARDLGLPRSTVYHLLAVLREEGFVAHLPGERRYGLGVAAFEVGSAYSRQAPLQWIARPVLADLVDSTTHNGHFAVLHGRDVLYVIEERAVGRPSLVTDVGVRLPAPVTASGLAMLAALPAQQVRALFPRRSALVQRDGAGPSSPSELRRLLAEVRHRGHAHEDGSVTAGFASVASAVLDHGGHPIAAVALTFPAVEVDAVEREGLIDEVRLAASRISRGIRGRVRDPVGP